MINEEKFYKLSKRLNKFKIEDIVLISGYDEFEVKKYLKKMLINKSVIFIDDEYVFNNKKENLLNAKKVNIKKTNSTKKNKLMDELFYLFRDYYLLCSLPSKELAINLAKKRFLRKYPDLNNQSLINNKQFYYRLHKEFTLSQIAAYRSGAIKKKNRYFNTLSKIRFSSKKGFSKQPDKRSIKERPKYFPFKLNSLMINLKDIFTYKKNDLLNKKKLRFNNKNLSIQLQKNTIKVLNLKVLDFFIALVYLYEVMQKQDDGSVIIHQEDILFLLHYKTTRKGNSVHYSFRQKVWVESCFEFYNNLFFYERDNYKKPLNLLCYNKYNGEIKDNITKYKIWLNKDLISLKKGKLKSNILFTNSDSHSEKYKIIAYYLMTQNSKKIVKNTKDWIKLLNKEFRFKTESLEYKYLDKIFNTLLKYKIINSWNYEKNQSTIEVMLSLS